MYKDLSTLQKELKRIRYSSITIDGEDTLTERVANIRANDKDGVYKNWTDLELMEYVRLGVINQNHRVAKNSSKVLSSSNRPDYPEWNAYSYEEILQLKESGTSIPDDLLEWAYSMANTDTTSYEIDTTDISNTTELNCLDTDINANGSVLKTQKALQQLVSKETAQKDLLTRKSEELQLNQALVSQQQETLAHEQDVTLDKIEELKKEFEKLEAKLRSGEQLSDDELARHNELVGLLNIEGNRLQFQTNNMESQISSLLTEIDTVSEIVDVNNALGENISGLQRTYAPAEATRKGSLYSKNTTGVGVSGLTSMLYYSALSGSLSRITSTVNLDLSATTASAAFNLNKNISLANLIQGRIEAVQNMQMSANTAPAQTGVNTPEAEEQPQTVPIADTQETVAATGEVVAPEQTVETTDTTAVDETETTSATQENTASQEELKIQEYATTATQKASETEIFNTQFTSMKNQVITLSFSAKKDKENFEKSYNEKLTEYNILLDKLSGDKTVDPQEAFLYKIKYGIDYNSEFNEEDLEKYNALRAELDTESGVFAQELQKKLEVFQGFTNLYQTGLQTVESNIVYAEEVITAGKAYALAQNGLTEDDVKFYTLYLGNSEKIKDVLYGKSGESIGRDALDGGEALLAVSTESKSLLEKSVKENTFAETQSADLTQTKVNMNEEVGNMNTQFDELFAQKDEEEKAKDAQDKSEKKSEEPDAASVEKQGAEAKQSAKKANQEGETAEKDENAYKKDIKKEETALRKYQRQIKNETKKMQDNNRQIADGNKQVDEYSAIVSGLVAEMSASRDAAQTRNQKTSDNIANENAAKVSTANSYYAQVAQINERSERLGQAVTSSGDTITVLQKKSSKMQKNLTKTSTAKYKATVKKQKDAEQEAKDKQKPIQTVTTIGYVFTGIKMVGLGLMLIPFTHAVGLIMYGVGTYGELACYATNTALNVAQGNWLGAGICLAAAAMSYFSGPNPSNSISSGVKQLSTDAAKEATKNAAKQGTTEIIKDTAQQGTEELVKEGAKQGTEELAKESLKDTAMTQVMDSSKSLISNMADDMLQQGMQTIMSNAAKSMAELSTQIATQMIKTATKQMTQQALLQTALSSGTGLSQQLVSKNADKNTNDEQNKNAHAAQGRHKSREAVKKALQMVKRKKGAQNAK